MDKRKMTIISLFLVCIFLLPTTLLAKKQITRPYKVQGNVRLTLNLMTMEFEFNDWGEATHLGRYSNIGSGWVTDPSLANGYCEGTLTAANKDQIYWKLVAEDGEWNIFFTGGEGRFENATGGFTAISTLPEVTPVFADDGEPPIALIYTFSFTGNGTISY